MIKGILGIGRDITERKRAEKTLLDSRNMLQTVLDSIPSAVFWKDHDLIYLGGNRTWMEASGLKSSEEVVGKSDYDLPWGKKQADSFREYDRKIMESGIPEYDIVEPYLRADGTISWAKTNKVPLRDTEGNIVGVLGTYEDITERKQTEEKLRLEKENFRHSLDNSPLGVRIATIEGNTIYANKTLLNFYGYDSLEELQKTPLKDRYTPESYAEAQERKLQREHGDLSITDYEISIVRKNREIRNLQVFRKEILWDGVRQFQVICNDITERKQAENALFQSEKKLKALFEVLPVGVSILDAERNIAFVNPALEKILNITKDGFIRGDYKSRKYLRPDGTQMPEEEFASIRAIREQQAVHDVETGVLMEDGHVIWTNVNAVPVAFPDWKVVIITTDINERKLKEVELRESKQKISEALEFNRKILNTSSIGILTYKKSGQCISANEAAANATGATVAQLLAQNFHEIPSWKKSGMYKAAIKALDTGIEQLLDVRLVTTFGKDVWLSFSFSSFNSEGEQHLLVFTSDITEHKHSEEEIRKSKELLEDLHKHLNEILENERALISREIHDQIGQSLTALKLDLNWMHKYINTNPEVAAKYESMIELVSNTIKDVQRISSDLRPGILDDLGLAAAIEWYSEEFEKRTGIKCSLSLDDSILGDSQKDLIFFRVLQEALTNVIRHANASSVSIKLYKSKSGTAMTILDNGIGMLPEKAESGKSLGLIGMRERVRQFGGKIDISSKKGHGTKLTIIIPEKKINLE
jgi:PAS domain S-box-containing protein